MSNKPLAQSPVFPIPGHPVTRTNRFSGESEVGFLPAIVHEGISLLDAFALSAPPMPGWFELHMTAERPHPWADWPWFYAQRVIDARPKPTAAERAINGKEQS
jgi:hypothetical protein